MIPSTCSHCRHFRRWGTPPHSPLGTCTDPSQWGEGGRRLTTSNDGCDSFAPTATINRDGSVQPLLV